MYHNITIYVEVVEYTLRVEATSWIDHFNSVHQGLITISRQSQSIIFESCCSADHTISRESLSTTAIRDDLHCTVSITKYKIAFLFATASRFSARMILFMYSCLWIYTENQ